MDYRINHKRIKKLPAIFPLVLYNGRADCAQQYSRVVEQEPSSGKYAIQFNYLLLNERKYTKNVC